MTGRSNRSDSSITPAELTEEALARTPRVLGRYELITPIGGGGMATVYLARARGPGGFQRLVAIKLCHEHLSSEQQHLKMFLDEARLAGRIHHPNVVSTLDVDDSPTPFIVMEYVEGASLSMVLTRVWSAGGSVPIGVAVRIMLDVLTGLQAAHELRGDQGELLHLVHRDVSPQNILVGTDGVARITDFGVAKAEDRLAATVPGDIKGKFAYMAPEQLLSNAISPQTDVFSAAIVLWETLTGRRLFKAESPTKVISKVLSGPIRWPSHYRPEVTRGLDDVIMGGLERDPSRRYRRASDLAEALTKSGVEIASHTEVGDFLRHSVGDILERLDVALRSAPTRQPERADEELFSPRCLSDSTGVNDEAERRPRRTLVIFIGLAIVACVAFVGSWWIFGQESAPELDVNTSDPAVPSVEPSIAPRPPVVPVEQPDETESQPLAPAKQKAKARRSGVRRRLGKSSGRAAHRSKEAPRDQRATTLSPPVVP